MAAQPIKLVPLMLASYATQAYGATLQTGTLDNYGNSRNNRRWPVALPHRTRSNKPVSDVGLIKAVKKLTASKAAPYGFRYTASTSIMMR
jgi:hypothetical protein